MKYWIWLSIINKLGPVKKMKLLDFFKSPEKIYYASEKELLLVDGINDEIIENIKKSKNETLLRKYEIYIKTHDIKLINIVDDEYPENLRNIYDPPITLFARGNVDLLKKRNIGIIGCREPSGYGIEVAQKFSYELSENNIVVISGMARGIDTCAHVGTFRKTGETIAVLGCGIDIIYPTENINIYNEILKRGLIISEYIVGTKPEKGNFPARNRIISGISSGVLVIEAKEKSGTMITTDFALEQGKELYVIPGNITSETSKGTNKLIKEGAKVVTDIQDIIEDLV